MWRRDVVPPVRWAPEGVLWDVEDVPVGHVLHIAGHGLKHGHEVGEGGYPLTDGIETRPESPLNGEKDLTFTRAGAWVEVVVWRLGRPPHRRYYRSV